MKPSIILLYHISSLFLLSSIIPLTTSSTSTCNPNDKNILLKIKSHFSPNALPFTTWDPTTDCCSWIAVACDNPQAPGRVSFLGFGDPEAVGMSGPIPSEVGDLPYLDTLSFSQIPNLTGSIPKSITKLARLQELDIYLTSLSGPIPDFLGGIKSLLKLQLFQNQFSGVIPPSLGYLPNLYTLVLSGNKLSGPIPESFGSFKTPLVLLDLSDNNLSGSIPKSMGKLNISSLDLSNNHLVGDALFLFGKDKPLTILRLRQNQLKFDFGNVVRPSGLATLDIAFNQVYGSIPREFGQFHGWSLFNVSYNQLCGKVPKGRRLKQFSLYGMAHNKCLCDAPGLPACK